MIMIGKSVYNNRDIEVINDNDSNNQWCNGIIDKMDCIVMISDIMKVVSEIVEVIRNVVMRYIGGVVNDMVVIISGVMVVISNVMKEYISGVVVVISNVMSRVAGNVVALPHHHPHSSTRSIHHCTDSLVLNVSVQQLGKGHKAIYSNQFISEVSIC